MKVETSTCTKVVISDLMKSEFRLDPITVFLEDIGPSQGKIIIECYGKSWSAYWGGMGEHNIAEFFCSCDDHYLAKNLSRVSPYVFDGEKMPGFAREQIIDSRKEGEIDSETARELYDEADDLRCEYVHELDPDLMQKIFGDEWFRLSLPDSPNPDYEYLCRIISAVQAGLRSMQKAAA